LEGPNSFLPFFNYGLGFIGGIFKKEGVIIDQGRWWQKEEPKGFLEKLLKRRY